MTNTTFDDAVDRAVNATKELNELPKRRQSAKALLKNIQDAGNVTAEMIDDLEHKLPNLPLTRSFVNMFSRDLGDGRYAAFPADVSKVLKIFNSLSRDGTAGELGAVGATPAAAVAVAIRLAERRWPEAFGTVDNLDAYDAKAEAIRADLDAALDAMRSTVSGSDLIFDQGGLSNDEKKAGHAVVKFRSEPSLVFHQDWPLDLISRRMAREADHRQAA